MVTLGIVGYSTRALVQAVCDLGWQAVSIDAFGDQDTCELAVQAHVAQSWPDDVWHYARQSQIDGWLLAGGMENCSGLIDQLAALAPVLGPDQTQMAQLRSSSFWHSLVDGIEGLGWPDSYPSTTHVLNQGTDTVEMTDDWLVKSTASSGGWQIRTLNQLSGPISNASYIQRRILGRDLGVTLVFYEDAIQLVGVTQSLAAGDWPGPTPFIYRGSFGPIQLRAAQRRAIEQMALRIKSRLPAYRGWLQADLIEDALGRLWLLELNPRWTAGMEVLQATATSPAGSPLAMHLEAWEQAPSLVQYSGGANFFAKAIYYAPKLLVLEPQDRRVLQGLRKWQETRWRGAEWSVADIPRITHDAAARFQPGEPVFTWRVRLQPAPGR